MFDKCLVYLDHLRLEGLVNMYGAAPYLCEEFDITPEDAKLILIHWMETFDERA